MSSFAGTSSDSVSAVLSASALSNAVGRIDMSLSGELFEMTLAKAFPA